MRHEENHRSERIGWLRAAVMGANDGIVSTASLILGVAAAGGTGSEVAIAGRSLGVVIQLGVLLSLRVSNRGVRSKRGQAHPPFPPEFCGMR